MKTNTEYPGYEYEACRTCGEAVLAFTLTQGECSTCRTTG